MAHLHETSFTVGQPAWHRLSKVLTQAPETAQEAMIEAGMDWEVEVRPIYTSAFEESIMDNPLGGNPIQGPGTFISPAYRDDFEQVKLGGVVRRNTDGAMMGLVGPRWTPVQNRDAFEFFDPMVQAGHARYHTAGSLDGGKVVWVLCQVGEEAVVMGDDTVANFLLLSNAHTGARGIIVTPTGIRVVCANTLGWAEATTANIQMSFHHTSEIKERLTALSKFLEGHARKFDDLMMTFRFMAGEDVAEADVEFVLNHLFPDPVRADGTPANPTRTIQIRDRVRALFEGEQKGLDRLPAHRRRTRWTLWNALTEYVDHERGRTDDSRIHSAWWGDGATLKRKAKELILAGRS